MTYLLSTKRGGRKKEDSFFSFYYVREHAFQFLHTNMTLILGISWIHGLKVLEARTCDCVSNAVAFSFVLYFLQTGGDGCICYFEHDRSRHNLEFVGIKQVKELSTIRSVFTNADQQDDLPSGSCAIGFSSSDFIIWNLISETKVLSILPTQSISYSFFSPSLPHRNDLTYAGIGFASNLWWMEAPSFLFSW